MDAVYKIGDWEKPSRGILESSLKKVKRKKASREILEKAEPSFP
jgi:hypothetical protein